MNQRIFEWKERGNKWYYFDAVTGKIVGTANRQALDEIWIAFVYTGIYTFTLDDERHLGQYIDMNFAKDAVMHYWDVQSRTMIEN